MAPECSRDPFNAFLRLYELPKMRSPRALKFAVKDCVGVGGAPLTFGLRPPLFEYVQKDAAIVSLLKGAGMLLVGSTNLDEACLDAYGMNRHYGTVLNPLQRGLISGGSSSGSAAAVASGRVDVGVGTDFSGSIRVPAACCGIVGLKPSSSHFPREGAVLLDESLDAIGVMTRSLDELCQIPLLHDDSSQKDTLYTLSPTALRKVEHETRAAYEALVERAARSFAIKEIPPSLDFDHIDKQRKILCAQAWKGFVERLAIDEAHLPREGVALLQKARQTSPHEFQLAVSFQAHLQNECLSLFEEGLIGTPTLPAHPRKWSLGEARQSKAAPLNYFCGLANLCDVAALSFPTTIRLSDGFPFSLQLVGAGARIGALLSSTRVLSR